MVSPSASNSLVGHIPDLRRYARSLTGDTWAADDLVQLDWWYDTRSFDRHTVEELAEQLPLALIELTSEAIPPVDAPMAVGH